MNKRLWLAVVMGIGMTTAMAQVAERPSEFRLTADHMRYVGNTGNVVADGNVELVYGSSIWQTDRMVGNYETMQYQIPNNLHWTDAVRDVDMTLSDVHYEHEIQEADFAAASGVVGKLFLVGRDGTFSNALQEGHLNQAVVTTVSAMAQVPDYRLEADSVDIFPNARLVAKNVSFYIKNHRILSFPTYRTSFRSKNGGLMSFVPVPRYKSHNGLGIRARWFYPIGPHAEAFFNYEWYVRKGLKPDIGVRYFASYGDWTLRYRKEESTVNEDSIWIEKRPELSFISHPVYMGGSHFYGQVDASIGDWHEGGVNGWHKHIGVAIKTDGLALGPKMTWYPIAGYRKDFYDASHSQRSNAYYGLRVEREIGSKLDIWGAIRINHFEGQSPYIFDRYDLEKWGSFGFKYDVDRLNAFGVEWTWNLENGSLHDQDISWYRDLHSFKATVTYRVEQDKWEVRIRAKDF